MLTPDLEPVGAGPAVVILAKAPRPGTVKTRLTPPLTPDEAAGLCACLFRDTAAIAAQAVATVIVAHEPASGRLLLEPLAPNAALWWPQPAGDLGVRQADALSRGFREGYSPVLLMGADSPTLPPDWIAAAARTLQDGAADLTVVPAADGGYVLLGLRAPAPGLFDAIAWSTDRVCAQLIARAQLLGLRVHQLAMGHDVDHFNDLLHLRREMAGSDTTRTRAPATWHWLEDYFRR